MPTLHQYRSDLDELVRLAHIDLAALWRHVSDAIVARKLLAGILPDLTAVYGSAAGTLAADWYDELRDQRRITGRFSALVADVPPVAQTEAVAGWAVTSLFSSEPDFDGALSAAQGGLQRLIANVGRDTITGSSIADPKARGWQRSTAGGCDFCQSLDGRIYSENGDFPAHDHCRCAAFPVFG